MELEALGDEAVPATLGVHPDDEEFGAVLVAERGVIHRFVEVVRLGWGKFNMDHGQCPTDDSQNPGLASSIFHKS